MGSRHHGADGLGPLDKCGTAAVGFETEKRPSEVNWLLLHLSIT